MESTSGYYKQVGDYYDKDAVQFEKRYWENPILQHIRTSFREITNQYAFKHVLEIGYGPGLDMIYFAQQHPDAQVYGVDISKGMYDAAKNNADQLNLKNVHLAVGSVEDVETLFHEKKFDLIYVFFGALNTVEDLKVAATKIESLLNENGVAVLTFVNKWYLKGFLVPFIKGRFSIAFARFRKIWGGYSPRAFLPSKCYSIGEIKAVFKALKVEKIKGYSIAYPAWYDGYKFKNKTVLNFLWKTDQFIGSSIARGLGEYALFVFRKRS